LGAGEKQIENRSIFDKVTTKTFQLVVLFECSFLPMIMWFILRCFLSNK